MTGKLVDNAIQAQLRLCERFQKAPMTGKLVDNAIQAQLIGSTKTNLTPSRQAAKTSGLRI